MDSRREFEHYDGLRPIEPLPSIREVCKSSFEIYRKHQTHEEREAEDLNDKKCAWYVAACGVPENLLTERDRMFLKKYKAEGLKFSLHWNFKPEITALLESKRREFLSRANNYNDKQ